MNVFASSTPLALFMACLTPFFISFRSGSEDSLFLIQNLFQLFFHPGFIDGEDCDLFNVNDSVHTERHVCRDCLHLLADIAG